MIMTVLGIWLLPLLLGYLALIMEELEDFQFQMNIKSNEICFSVSCLFRRKQIMYAGGRGVQTLKTSDLVKNGWNNLRSIITLINLYSMVMLWVLILRQLFHVRLFKKITENIECWWKRALLEEDALKYIYG